MARVTCPECGDVAVEVELLSVTRGLLTDRFQFRCPRCDSRVAKDADPHVGSLLLAAGATRVIERPATLVEVAVSLAELHGELDGDDWLARLLAAPLPPDAT
jgi:DNA-directed RNA polymerase subunit RPC12/RpoP